jgi:hypothetical protein
MNYSFTECIEDDEFSCSLQSPGQSLQKIQERSFVEGRKNQDFPFSSEIPQKHAKISPSLSKAYKDIPHPLNRRVDPVKSDSRGISSLNEGLINVVVDENHEKEEKKKTKKAMRVSVSDEQIEKDFQEWWAKYPRNREGSQPAFRAYVKAIRKTSHQDLVRATTAYAEYREKKIKDNPSKDSHQYTPLAATWLNQERWTDRVIQEAIDQLTVDINQPRIEINYNIPPEIEQGLEAIGELKMKLWFNNAELIKDVELPSGRRVHQIKMPSRFYCDQVDNNFNLREKLQRYFGIILEFVVTTTQQFLMPIVESMEAYTSLAV